MRPFRILCLTFVIAVCGTSSAVRAEARPATPLAFLLTSAASDFHQNAHPAAARFREVRLGHYKTESGEEQYVLCGQFLPQRENGKAKWTAFATVRTSGYEQWVGAQSRSYCRHSGMKWEGSADLSLSLQIRLEALQAAEAK